MNNIIQEILEKSIKNILKISENLGEDSMCFDTLAQSIKKETDNLGLNVLKAMIENIEEQIKNNKQVRKTWDIVRKDKRTILTQLGELTFERRYFYNIRSDEYSYLTDKIFEIESYKRIDKGLSAQLVNQATDLSYAKSAQLVANDKITKQTVKNKIEKVAKLNVVDKLPENKREAEILYVAADEDHISAQKGSNMQGELIYIFEGIESVGKNRTKLKNVHYIGGVLETTESLWESVDKYIQDNYDVDKIKRIYLSGDGAAWIKAGVDYLGSKVRFVLDKFHLVKYIRKASGHMKEYCGKILEQINLANKEGTLKIIDELDEKTEIESKKKRIEELRKYITNNWEGIEIYAIEDKIVLGCSAEGHISHVLSSRMSSRPMGWSKVNAGNMVKLRVYKSNNIDIYDLILNAKETEKDENKTDKKIIPERTKKSIVKKASKYLTTGVKLPIIELGKTTKIYNLLKNICIA